MIFSLFRRDDKRGRRDPGLDISVFEKVLESGDAQAWWRLATQLVAFVEETDTSPEDRAVVMPILIRLASCPDRAVRAHVAALAREARHVSLDLVLTIAAGEEDISLPFIERAVAIGPTLQMAIFRAGDVARRKAVCRRRDLCAEVAHEAIMVGERAVALECIRNDQVALSPKLARRAYLRFREDEELVDALLRRHDLPLEVRLAHVEVMAGRMRAVMKEAGWAEAQRALDAAASMEERALVNILAEAGDEEKLISAFEFLSRRGRLTAAVLLRAACGGHVAVLVHGLAWLARMKVARLRQVLRPNASLTLARTALMRSGLPEGVHALALGVLLAARRRGEEAARPGVRLAGFGPLVLEAIAGTELLSVAEKMQAAGMLQRLSDERTRELAARFVQSLLRHAA